MVSITRFVFSLPARPDLGDWAGARLRGVLGKALRRIACATHARTCHACPVRDICAYAYCFETRAAEDGKFHSGGQDVPRPYILRRPSWEPERGLLRFDLVLVGRAVEMFTYFALAIKDWEQPHMGPDHSAGVLEAITQRHPFSGECHPVYTRAEEVLFPLRLHLSPTDIEQAAAGIDRRVAIRFLTPTRLKHRGREVTQAPPFHTLIAALCRRFEALEQAHDLPRIIADPRGLIGQSDGVRLAGWEGHREARERYSYRQKQRMHVEGIVGEAVYEGDLRPFGPALKLGELVHVGKGAVFGLGEMEVS